MRKAGLLRYEAFTNLCLQQQACCATETSGTCDLQYWMCNDLKLHMPVIIVHVHNNHYAIILPFFVCWADSQATCITAVASVKQPFPEYWHLLQAMLHYLGQPQQQDQCLLHEAKQDCFLELAMTLSGSYVTVNSNTKTSSEVRHHGAATVGM